MLYCAITKGNTTYYHPLQTKEIGYIYDRLLNLTNGDEPLSMAGADWADAACVAGCEIGDTLELTDDITMEIVED